MNTSCAANNRSLYVIIRDEVTDWIIKNGLSKTESKLFFYFLKLDRFGDKPVRLKVAEILLATGIGKTAYHAAIAKFEALGWFDFKHTDVTISNQTGLSSSEKRTEKPESRTEKPESRTEKPESRTKKPNQESEKTDNQPLETLPNKPFEASHTIQTYSDLKHNTDQDCGVKNSDFDQEEDQLPRSGVDVLPQFTERLKLYQIYLSIFDQKSGLLIPNPKIEKIYQILEGMSPEKAESAIRAFLAWLSTAKNVRCKYAAFAASLRNQWEINQ